MKYRTFASLDKIYNLLAPKAKGVAADTETIISLLKDDNPCMISRFGSTELQTLCYSRFFPLSLPLKRRTYYNIQYASGFFPVNKKNLNRFFNIYKENIKEIDLLISWRAEEFLFYDWLKSKPSIRKSTLDNFYEHSHPWTYALKDKSILIIHPFAETIERQYKEKRELLFDNPEVLPEFSKLQTIKAVQSIAGNPVNFTSWFDALKWMEKEIDKLDFDIALLGCGAYAMPLAAHIKKMGKKAIHLGGVLQFLFGIKGKRYIDNSKTSKYINEHFVFPSNTDKPKLSYVVEGGCYW